MSDSQELDEIVWRSPTHLQEFGGVHSNVVLYYFAASPFFDPMSNNAVIWTQATSNQSLQYTITTRALFEDRLRQMQGLEFMVIHDPTEGDKKQDHSGVWVIRKQIRRKVPGQQDEITPMKSYIVMGENIFMAPSLGDVISCKLMSILTSLNKFSSTLAELPSFTPSLGHHYIPPTTKTHTSISHPQTSKATTPIPGSTPQPSDPASAPKPTDTQANPSSSAYDSTRLFTDAWRLTLEYGNDYMDENPVVGEPGNFKLTRSKDLALPTTTTSASSKNVAQPFKAVKKTAPPIKTDIPMEEKDKKSGLGTGKSPTTPGTVLKDKKGRRKSKAAGVATPKAETPKVATPS